MQKLTYEDLKQAVAGTAAGFRAKTRLEPLGGPDDKLYPPTFGDAVRVPVPVALERGGEKAGSPAVINHGNVKPSQDAETGGVAVSELRFGRRVGTEPATFRGRTWRHSPNREGGLRGGKASPIASTSIAICITSP